MNKNSIQIGQLPMEAYGQASSRLEEPKIVESSCMARYILARKEGLWVVIEFGKILTLG